MSELNKEYPTALCKYCNKTKVKIFKTYHKATANGDSTKRRRKFEDESKQLWHGERCPDCATEYRRELTHKKQDKIKADLKKKLEE
jgi:hypothetical protein